MIDVVETQDKIFVHYTGLAELDVLESVILNAEVKDQLKKELILSYER